MQPCTKNDPPVIRAAGPGDAAAIAMLHTESWREVYRGILPDAYLDHEIAGERLRHWTAALEQIPIDRGHDRACVSAPAHKDRAAPGSGFALVARHGDTPSGFIAVTRDSEPGYDAVVDSLHVAAAWRGTGLGRRLMGQAAARLLADGASSVCLRVFDANEGAIRFYRRLGGRVDGTGVDPFAGANMPDTRFGWRDLAALRDACADGGKGAFHP